MKLLLQDLIQQICETTIPCSFRAARNTILRRSSSPPLQETLQPASHLRPPCSIGQISCHFQKETSRKHRVKKKSFADCQFCWSRGVVVLVRSGSKLPSLRLIIPERQRQCESRISKRKSSSHGGLDFSHSRCSISGEKWQPLFRTSTEELRGTNGTI